MNKVSALHCNKHSLCIFHEFSKFSFPFMFQLVTEHDNCKIASDNFLSSRKLNNGVSFCTCTLVKCIYMCKVDIFVFCYDYAFLFFRFGSPCVKISTSHKKKINEQLQYCILLYFQFFFINTIDQNYVALSFSYFFIIRIHTFVKYFNRIKDKRIIMKYICIAHHFLLIQS